MHGKMSVPKGFTELKFVPRLGILQKLSPYHGLKIWILRFPADAILVCRQLPAPDSATECSRSCSGSPAVFPSHQVMNTFTRGQHHGRPTGGNESPPSRPAANPHLTWAPDFLKVLKFITDLMYNTSNFKLFMLHMCLHYVSKLQKTAFNFL